MAKRRRHSGPKMAITFRCRTCAMKFRVEQYDDDPDPKCPNLECGAVQTPIGMDVGGGRAPAIGGSLNTRAMDTATRMVMEDQGLTDLQEAKREGDTMAPKLSTTQQRMADSMFDPAARKALLGRARGNPLANRINALARGGAAAAGVQVAAANANQAPAVDPIAAIHRAQTRPPVHFVNEGG